MNNPATKFPTIDDREALVLSLLQKHPARNPLELRHTYPHILNPTLFRQTLNGLIDAKLADERGATVDGRIALLRAKAFYASL